MNILETFDLFLRRPLSILKHGLVSIVHIRAENMFAKKAINVDMTKTKTQITVVNNEKVYNLLKLVTYRAAQRGALADKSSKPKIETFPELKE
ncbi:MAG: hypothetical protein LUB59_02195 [Candidatus Gastranaerophilales bacterium]|nr:hypothetical protein [Candidatus Gastranaerophilales bacterium]